jgi:imidazolonepropionase-like amidohydrolase
MKATIQLFTALLLSHTLLLAQARPVVIKAATLLDGKGGVRRNVSVTVEGSKIREIGPATTTTYDLRGLTVLPGLIDTHVHIAWHLGPDGRYQPRDDSPVTALGTRLKTGM